MRVQSYACFGTHAAVRLKGAMQMRARLFVHGDPIRACVSKRLDVAFWFYNHEVDIERGVTRCRLHGLYDGRTHGDVGYESTVHVVDVDPVCTALYDILYVFSEAAEIGR